MNPNSPVIKRVTARAVDAPISRPVKNAFGIFGSAPLVLIDVLTEQGSPDARTFLPTPG
jgi:mandelate racemase